MTALALATAVALVLLAGPLLLGVTGWRRARTAPSTGAPQAWDWSLVIVSALIYTLAFNLTFFVQELFLVLPKALTPGLQPTLFHNNHRWNGDNPLAGLFQGTGALATALVGLACLWVVRHLQPRSVKTRLFGVWMAYCGLLMALPQVVIGALSTGSDVGMAMQYLHLSPTTRLIAALVALAAMPLVALRLLRPLLAIAREPQQVGDPMARTRFVAQVALVPVLLGTALIIPFRVPREALEVVLLPVLVGLIGVPWMLAGAWRVRDARACGRQPDSFVLPLLAAIALLLVFQLLLRPGIDFY